MPVTGIALKTWNLQDGLSLGLQAGDSVVEGAPVLAFRILMLLLPLALGCARKVDVRINGRTPDHLGAELRAVEGGWEMSAELPVGTWHAALQEGGKAVRVETAGTRSVARWYVSRERMMEGRPFVLSLSCAPGEEPTIQLKLSPKYRGQGFVEGVLNVLYYVGRGRSGQ